MLGSPWRLNRRQTHPQHRHPLGLEDADHLVDLFSIEFDPAFLAKSCRSFGEPALFSGPVPPCAIAVGGIVRRQFGIRHLGCAIRLRRDFSPEGLPSGLALASFLSPPIVGFVGCRLADCDAVVKPEHDDNGVRFFSGEMPLRRRPNPPDCPSADT